MSYNIKWVDDKIDYKNLVPLSWDVTVRNKPYKAYHIEGYYHTIGSKWDDVWCCPRDEEPSKENLVGYGCRGICEWGIETKINHYKNYKHECIDDSIYVIITRNGEHFYDFSCHDLSYGLAKAQMLLTHILEHPINFSDYEFDKQLIGRKVYYRDEPAIIRSYVHGQCCVMIEPDGMDKFKTPCWAQEDGDWDPYEQDIKVDCLEDQAIWWFRD